MGNICHQTDCLYNTKDTCLMYREPVWENFGTKECLEEVEEMLKCENNEETNG